MTDRNYYVTKTMAGSERCYWGFRGGVVSTPTSRQDVDAKAAFMARSGQTLVRVDLIRTYAKDSSKPVWQIADKSAN